MRETLEIGRDPVRLVFAFLGTVILMFVLGYGISLDVEDIAFAVMDRDQSPESRDYIQSLAGSRYFDEKTPILSDAEMDERMRSGDISMAIEIPPDYGKDMRHGQQPSVSVWVDGSMPYRAETIKGYIQGFHLSYLSELSLRQFGIKVSPSYQLVSRYRYNPQVESLISMVPGVLPILLLMITSMLTALSIVREKELGSITNFYATPVNRLEFLMGKQLPYIVIGMMNFLMLMWLVYMVFDVPLTGSFWALLVGTFLYIVVATCMGQFISAFTKTQIAAIFLTMITSIVPCVNYAGLINPINSLEGAGYVVGHIYPASYYLLICRGAFTKGLGFDELNAFYWPMALAIVVLMCLSWLLLKKQDK
ncbi:ABC transporter permease [Methylophaga thalassica]